jgi:nucleoside 2-deoxyribosyltransferase
VTRSLNQSSVVQFGRQVRAAKWRPERTDLRPVLLDTGGFRAVAAIFPRYPSGVRAYISGALLNAAHLDQSRALYERFAEACASAGWDAYVPHQHADPVRDPHLSNVEVAERDVAHVTAADVLVAYVGEPSLGVGAEVAIALSAGKRVLLLAEADRRVSRFLLGLAELHAAQTSVLRYQTIEQAVEWIKKQLTSTTNNFSN